MSRLIPLMLLATSSLAIAQTASKDQCTGDIVGKWTHIATGNAVYFNPDCRFEGTECQYVGKILNSPRNDEGTMLVQIVSSKGGEGCMSPATHPCKYRMYKNLKPLEAVVTCAKDPARTIIKEK